MNTLALRLVLLVVVVVVVVGVWQTAYARGLEAGKAEVSGLRSEFVQARQGALPAGAASSGGPVIKTGGAAQGQRPGVTGTIERVDGETLTIATSDATVKVTLSDQTRIGKQTRIDPSDLKAGDRVLVAGEQRSETDYSATSIQVQEPAGR